MKKLITAFVLMLLSLNVQAFPAWPSASRMLKLADGTQVYARLCGDQFAHYWKTDDGRCFVALGHETYQETDEQALLQAANRQRLQDKLLHAQKVQRRQQARAAQHKLGEDNHIEYKGLKKGLVILVDFKDKKFQASHKKTFFERMCNELNYSSKVGFVGSVKDYFLAQSNNMLELDFDVVGPYTMAQGYAFYGQNKENGGGDAHVGEMIVAAINGADADVNFADYDWDNDGEVDQIYILYAGMGEAAGGDENTIWPHEWTLSSAIGNTMQRDGVVLDTYACSSEQLFSVVVDRVTGKQSIVERTGGIGTMCHEFTHCLGIPDMYDTHDSGFMGTGDFDPMCNGSYNEDSFRPCNYTAYERIYAGWQEPYVLDKPATIKNMASSSDWGTPFIIYNDANPNEYYLLENRQKTGWDAALPYAGLMVTHVDFDATVWEYNLVNSKYTIEWYGKVYAQNDHERCGLIAANRKDGNFDGYNPLFPSTTLSGVFKNSITDTSDPAAILYNANNSGTKLMGKSITNIVQNADGTISFDFMGGSSSNVISGIDAAITDRDKATAPHGVYRLDGTYAGTSAAPLPKGIYIVNKKKVVK